MRILRPVLFLHLATSVCALDIQNWEKFEVDLVFPRNETYSPVSPFPVVFAFQNANVYTLYDGGFDWDISCDNAFYSRTTSDLSDPGDNNFTAPSDPYFFVSSAPNSSNPVLDPDDTWLESNVINCTLTWSFGFWTNCSDYGFELVFGGPSLGLIGGNISFSVTPGGKLPLDALRNYTECPIPGGTLLVRDATTEIHCVELPNISQFPSPGPCAVKFTGAAASSVISQIGTPTATFSPMPKTSTTSTTSTSTAVPTTTGSSPGNRVDGGFSESYGGLFGALAALVLL
jgi:hypothetical protein